MCGIVGFYVLSRTDLHEAALQRASDSLNHRGPDDSGIFSDLNNGIGLAHRRLSIIDVSAAGHQPMASDDGQVHIVYNGEVYNFRELRGILETRGYHFAGNSDTEVVLKGYIEWGVGCLQKMQGMFALAIWDQRQRRLLLARDRLGIKPLYYYYKDDTLLFASELKALSAFHSFPRVIDDGALAQYLHFQYIPAPRTVFKDTCKLMPGCYLLSQGAQPAIHRYWNLPEYDPNAEKIDEKLYLDELDQLLRQAVAEHLVSDVPIGALLSGGIDSSLVTALMKKTSAGTVRTFSIGFKDRKYNEAPWAARIAAHLGTEHTELYVEPGQALDVISRLPDIYDEPFADSSAVPTYLVSQLTRSHVTVALTGDGGDEQFAGYVRYWMTRSMADWIGRVPASIRGPFAAALGRVPVKEIERIYLALRSFLPQRFQVANFADKWQKVIMQMGKSQLSELYRMTICLWPDKDLQELIGQERQPSRFDALFNETSRWPVLARLMRVDQESYLPDAMLTKVDRASMAASLEVRVPLLDHRVVEFTSRLPETLKYRNGSGKYILKKLLTRYMPPELFERPKMGFGVPIDQWFRKELKGMLYDYLSPDRLKRDGRFNPDVVQQKLQEHLEGTCNHHYRLWALLMWQMWYERWMAN